MSLLVKKMQIIYGTKWHHYTYHIYCTIFTGDSQKKSYNELFYKIAHDALQKTLCGINLNIHVQLGT